MEETGQQRKDGWVRLCGVQEAPEEQKVAEVECEGVTLCLARVRGELLAVDNWCPHRQGPLGQGWVEGDAVVCPWHSWAFSLRTGVADYPENQQISVFPVRVGGEDVLVKLR